MRGIVHSLLRSSNEYRPAFEGAVALRAKKSGPQAAFCTRKQ
jgi:hypothetical protein